jgi:hypothetical protein
MAELIPEVSWSEFRKLKVWQLKRMKCCEVTADGEYLFTFVNGNIEKSGYLKTQAEYNCQTANAVGGESLDKILEEVLV